jgi:hypothetical protein
MTLRQMRSLAASHKIKKQFGKFIYIAVYGSRHVSLISIGIVGGIQVNRKTLFQSQDANKFSLSPAVTFPKGMKKVYTVQDKR